MNLLNQYRIKRINMKLIRVQRKRTKGFKLPENTVCVTRGTKFGNPFKVGDPLIPTNKEAVSLYKNWLNLQQVYYNIMADKYFEPPTEADIVKALRGKNLACYCGLDEFCHADILLKIANEY